MARIFDGDGSGLVDLFTKFPPTNCTNKEKDEEGCDDNMKKNMKRVRVEH